MFTPLLVRCGMILPFLPPLADLPPTECLLPPPGVNRIDVPESTAIAAQTRELVQLRRTLQMSPLAGSILNTDPTAEAGRSAVGARMERSDEAEFVQVLHRVVETAPVEVRSHAAADQSVPRESPVGDSADTASFLRSVGRQLDDLANDREEDQDYETADRLRQLSDQVRRRARKATR